MEKIVLIVTGYVGSALTPYLLRKGYEVTVRSFIYGNNIFEDHPNLKLLKEI